MKKIFFLLITLLSCWPVLADSDSDRILKSVASKLDAMGSYKVTYTLNGSGVTQQGTYEVRGDSYYLVAEEIEELFDGTDRYIVNHDSDEIWIDRGADESDLFQPNRLFYFTQGYRHRYVGQESISGKTTAKVVLSPTDYHSPINEINLWVDTSTGLPVRIEITGGDADRYEIRVTSITPSLGAPFRFDRSRYQGMEVLDFR